MACCLLLPCFQAWLGERARLVEGGPIVGKATLKLLAPVVTWTAFLTSAFSLDVVASRGWRNPSSIWLIIQNTVGTLPSGFLS